MAAWRETGLPTVQNVELCKATIALFASDFSALTGYVTTGLGQVQVLEGVSHGSEKNYMHHFNVGM
jgi:hypothetical protein